MRISTLILSLFLFLTQLSYAQTLSDSAVIAQIEEAVKTKKMLLEASSKLGQLYMRAEKNKDVNLMSRALYNKMLISDLRSEDTLYFKNSAYIDSLLYKKDSAVELKAIMHLMQAKRLATFNYRYLRFKRDRYETPGLISNYAKFNKKQLDSAAQHHFNKALLLSRNLKNIKGDLKWLSASPDVFLFWPRLSDIVFTEQINHLIQVDRSIYMPKEAWKSWIALSSAAFEKKLDSLSKTQQEQNQVLKSYNTWRKYHTNDIGKSAYIETLARKYIYQFNQYDTLVKKQYIKYLESESLSSYEMVRAHAVYQLALLWNSEGNQYQYGFDKKYQFLPTKALQLYEANKNLMKRYSFLDRILMAMRKQTLSKSMSLQTTQQGTTSDSIFVYVAYKNTPKLFYRVIKSSVSDYEAQSAADVESLLEKPFLSEVSLDLPLPADHNNHSTFFKVNGLENGHYHLVFSDEALKPEAKGLNFIGFSVTDLAAVNTDERVYILDRNSGLPKQKATVTTFYYKRGTKGERTSLKEQKQMLKVNKEGYVLVNKETTDQLRVVHEGDTLIQDFLAQRIELPRNLYNKEDYDDLEDFYDDQAKLHIYTDRAIYRPGQTVHFKAILLTKDSKTGDKMLWQKNGADTTKLYIQDPFGKKIDSLKMTVNAYGSFSGSFVLPKTGATGGWSIEHENTDIDYANKGNFQVEEYKRPSYELSLEQPKKTLKPGDAFSWKVLARSFNGANLNNIAIRYTVTRTGKAILPRGALKYYPSTNENFKLLDTTVYTNERGEIEVLVADSLIRNAQLSTDQVWNFNYQLKAEAIDATGEKAELSGMVNVSTRPYHINAGVKKVYDRQKLPEVPLSVFSQLEGIVGKNVRVRIYRIENVNTLMQPGERIDQVLYSEEQLNAWFPKKILPSNAPTSKELVFEKMVNTADVQKFDLPKDKLTSGTYEVITECIEKDQRDTLTGQAIYTFKVFDTGNGAVPGTDFSYVAFNQVKAGDNIHYYTAAEHPVYAIYQMHYYSQKHDGLHIVKTYQETRHNAGLHEFVFNVPKDAVEKLLLTKIYIHRNKIYKKEETLYISKDKSEEPEIIIERYRKIMAPGAKETFSVSVRVRNEKVAAELMTTLYDASLDKLQPHQWKKPADAGFNGYLSARWPYQLSFTSNARLNFQRQREGVFGELVRDEKVYDFVSIEGDALAGRVAGMSMANTQGLNEVVVTGYGLQKKQSLTGSITTIRGNTSLSDFNQPLVIVDGLIFQGDISSIQPSAITDIMVLKGAEASAIYGSKAANGVLVISTSGRIKLPGDENEPIVKIRKDFNETAFFFPHIYADQDGSYTFSFTMPETATSWNWKMLAHTKTALFGYAERQLTTQLSLMVQPNMPRLLYQGDEIVLQSRISNLDTLLLQGKARIRIEDAVTGESLTEKLVKQVDNRFSVDRKLTTNTSFLLKVPADQLNPLKIVVSAVSGSFSDAEEHIIPVSSTKVFVRSNQTLDWSKDTDTVVQTPELPVGTEFYGIGLSIDPKPETTLINSLPWLANYSFDCAEQTFNKLLAHATALKVMKNDTLVRRSWSQAMLAKENISKDTLTYTDKKRGFKLPDEMDAMAMPWLAMDVKTQVQQEQLIKLLDTLQAKAAIKKHLERLYQLQNSDGGLSWFDGGKSNAYISNYVLAGFGKIWKDEWNPDPDSKFSGFIQSLIRYADNVFEDKNRANVYGYYVPDVLYYIYGRSFWLDKPVAGNLSPATEANIKSHLKEKWKIAGDIRLSHQAMLIISTLRYFNTSDREYQLALDLLKSLRQLAITGQQNGMRWKDIADSDDLNNSAEETVALIAEAFAEPKDQEYLKLAQEVQKGLIKWLLTTKNEHNWRTTKGTAAAVDLLKRDNGTVVSPPKSIALQVERQRMTVSNDMLNGIPFQFFQPAAKPASLTLSKHDTGMVNGNISYYYFTSSDNLEENDKGILLDKKLYRLVGKTGSESAANQMAGKERWEEIKSGTPIKIGDRVKVILSVQTSKALQYVHIDDKRGAAFEPKEVLSGQQYQDGISYYRSIRDTGMQLFAEFLPSGRSEISYELVAAREGSFEGGVAVLQGMYQPAVTAYSRTEKVIVEKEGL